MKYPGVYHLNALIRHSSMAATEINGKWVPSRPEGFASWIHRFQAAWLVFTGRADALIWTEGQ